jgi:hypothetical protein
VTDLVAEVELMLAPIVRIEDLRAARARRRPEPRPFDLREIERVMGSSCTATTSTWLGLQRRQVYRLRLSGLTFSQADALAVRAGLHPADVWGSLWWNLSEW